MIHLALSLALAAAPGADAVPPTSVDGEAVSLTATLAAPPGPPFVVGVRSYGAGVLLRNEDVGRAVALRSVGWRFGIPSRNWHVRILGRTTSKRDGTVALDPLAQNLTDLWFEHGLLLPGEELFVPLDLPVQPGPTQRLEVAYAIVGDDIRGWRTEVLLPREDELSHAVFGSITTESLELRRLNGGGRALGRSTMKEGYLPLGEGTAVFEVPVESTTDDGRTGGVGPAEAAFLASRDQERDLVVSWEPRLKAWFIVSGDGRATMVSRGEAIELGDGWSPLAPALFNADGEGNSRALLHPDVFGDVTRVAAPTYERYFDPGATVLGTAKLRVVLERARERGLGVSVVAVDANGFGIEHLLAIGVRVDAAGRWLDPAIEPDEEGG